MATVSVSLGALILTQNGAASSYATVAEADAFHSQRLHNSDWNTASPATKTSALEWATSLLDGLGWKGSKQFQYNKLRWPRVDVFGPDGYELDNNEFPQFLKDATAEYAWELIKSDRTIDSDSAGIQKVAAGEVSVYFNDKTNPGRTPVNVIRQVSPYLSQSMGAFTKTIRA